LQRFLNDKNVAQPCPGTEKLHVAFTTEVRRTQRRSDGTLTLEGIRFEVPSRFGHLPELWLRYASWDLSTVYLADPKTGAVLCRIYPVDKTKNAEGRRAPRGSGTGSALPAPAPGMAPLLQKIIHQYATTGLPPAYLPQPQNSQNPS
jgi:putative transposase